MDTVTSTPITKRCTKCGKEKPITEFGRNPAVKDGFNTQCKECKCKYQRQYYIRHKKASSSSELAISCQQNPEFADKTPRELIASVKALIAELRARGYEYEGRLTYLQTIAL